MRSCSWVFILAVVCLAAAVAQAADDEPSVPPTGCAAGGASCAECVAIPTCGWCSTPVKYRDGTIGPNCAGFGPGEKRFRCMTGFSNQCVILANDGRKEVAEGGSTCGASGDL